MKVNNSVSKTTKTSNVRPRMSTANNRFISVAIPPAMIPVARKFIGKKVSMKSYTRGSFNTPGTAKTPPTEYTTTLHQNLAGL
mmetsp:Transcript_1224/g.2368  ORF Transcript_1224/g.2368 Transcript_1224/m.2368 type:complete len:83 (-) Transcript_1224:1219-1467(-)